VALPHSRPDIERVFSLRVLGVILNDKLTAAAHVTALLSSSMLYAMRVLRSRGTPTTSLQDIYSAQQSSRASCTRHHRGLACVQLPTTYALIPCYVAANGWATAEATCRSSPNCSILLTTTFSSASKLSLTMSSDHIFLNIQSLHTSSALALITSL